jgi:type I restriction enzyme R subunit
VVKVHIDRDVEGYRPEPKKRDLQGIEVEDRIYNQKDFDRSLVIDERTRLVAKKVSDLLRQSEDRFQKTIVFCVDTEHAARMRLALVNENSDLCAQFPRYVMRITGNDDEGVAQLDQFIDPESRFPVIVTTSRLLTTGIDAQTCRVIAIDREVGSMTEFKQIVGRGTRIHEDTKKYYFTLLDFRSRNSVWTEFSPTLPASLSPSPARRTAPTRMRCALDTATECWRHPRLRRPQMARRGGIPASRSRRTARRPPRTRSALHRETRHGA